MKNLLFILSIFISFVLSAQNEYVHQVLILNEGCYDYSTQEILDPVTVGVYDPVENTYTSIFEVDGARFSSDLILGDDCFYIAADNQILKYDLNTYELLSTVDCPGVRKLAIYNEYLIVSRGDYDPITSGPVLFDSYLHFYLKDNLSFSFSFDTENGPAWSTESLLVLEDKLYIAINNAYEWGNYKGLVGVVDLYTMNYMIELDLGENGNNPIAMHLKDNTIYTVNNKNWDGSSVSLLNTLELESTPQTIDLSDVSAGCGVSVIRDEKLNYQKNSDSEMYVFNLETLTPDGLEVNLDFNYYAVEIDPLSGYLYAAIANFTDNSGVIIYDQNNNQVNTFFADVAASKIVFDVRSNNATYLIDNSCDVSFIKDIDLLGRLNTNSEGLKVEISSDGSIQKKMIIK